jgi:hypothetical protein
VSAYQTTLLRRTEVAEGTMAFQFEKPNNFVFRAGQYIDLTISDTQAGSATGLTHTFSIASSPFDETLLVTTRMRDTVFKQTLFIGTGALGDCSAQWCGNVLRMVRSAIPLVLALCAIVGYVALG